MVRAKSAFTRKYLLICLFLPFFIGQVVRAYGWLIILGKEGLLNTFLTSLDSEGLVKRGDSYYSLDWDEAQYRVTVSVDAVLGGIDVVWIR